jgi:hypothetical protein
VGKAARSTLGLAADIAYNQQTKRVDKTKPGLTALVVLLSPTGLLLDAQQSSLVEELRAEVINTLDVRQGQPGRLRIGMVSRELLRFDFNPGDFSFVLSVKSPDVKDLLRTEGISGSYGPPSVSVLAPAAGDYELRVEAVDDADGPWTITFHERRLYVPGDESRILTQNSIFEGVRLAKQANADSLRAAVSQLASARQRSKAAGDAHSEALALTLLGRVQILRAQFKIAEDSLAAAMEIAGTRAGLKARSPPGLLNLE